MEKVYVVLSMNDAGEVELEKCFAWREYAFEFANNMNEDVGLVTFAVQEMDVE